VPLHIVDTAGLRSDAEASDAVERIGIGRSWQAIAQADIVLFLHDLVRLQDPLSRAADAAIAARLPPGVPVLQVYNKADLPGAATAVEGVSISALQGTGLDVLRSALLQLAGWQAGSEDLLSARQRHVQALHRAAVHLRSAQEHAAARDSALDLLAEELRLAHQALGEITGQVSSDDLLGVIFAGFCIGK
jgi:tRNA modification GTPase